MIVLKNENKGAWKGNRTAIKDKQHTFKLSNNIKFTFSPFITMLWSRGKTCPLLSAALPFSEYCHGNNRGWMHCPVVMVRYS